MEVQGMDPVKTLKDMVTVWLANDEGIHSGARLRELILRVRDAVWGLEAVTDSEAEAIARRIESRVTILLMPAVPEECRNPYFRGRGF